MILDIITAALIVIPMGIGMAKGFMYILVRLLGWAGALAAGFFAAPPLKEILADSFVGEYVHGSLDAQFGEAADGVSDAAGGLPAILSGVIEQSAQTTAAMIVETLEGVILSIASFLLIVVLTRLLLISVIRPLTRRKGKSPVSFLNKLAGLVTGGAEGLLLAFLFLAALIPVMKISSPETGAAIAEALKFSHLAGSLYDGNFLLAIFG